LKLRLATAADVGEIVSLVNSAYRGDSSRRGWTTEADLLGGQRTDALAIHEFLTTQPQNVMLVHADSAGRLLACVQLEQRGQSAYLGMLTIHPDHQASGLGRALLSAAEQFVQSQWRVTSVVMSVIRQRAELIAWYERRGYRQSGETAAFPYGDLRFGEPKQADLQFVILRKEWPSHESVMVAT
jgi:ribosomal protein S18 acetylase RimI-like enzyme